MFMGKADAGTAPAFTRTIVVRNRRKVEFLRRKIFIAAESKRVVRFKTRKMKQNVIMLSKYGKKIMPVRLRREQCLVIAFNHEGGTLCAQ